MIKIVQFEKSVINQQLLMGIIQKLRKRFESSF